MEHLTLEDLLSLQEAIQQALEDTNEAIYAIPASEEFDEVFGFLIGKAKIYVEPV
jgi:hypothetical protein